MPMPPWLRCSIWRRERIADRALGKSGALTGYHWGITRKQAMLGWEAGRVERAA